MSQKGGQPPRAHNPGTETPVIAEPWAMLLVFGFLQTQVIGQKAAAKGTPTNGTVHKVWLMPKDTANDWLVENKIPGSWKPSPTLVGTAELAIIENDIIKAINDDGGNYPPLSS